jgi:three-Cys-motif partner protein
VDEAFALIGQSPAFIYLDPFGADGLSLDVVRRTLALRKGEVFALFSPRAVYRHLSVLAVEDHVDRVRREVSESLFSDLDPSWLAAELERAAYSDASLMPTREAAERILGDLFGGHEEVQRILALPRATWLTEVLQAYTRILRESGATHVTAIAVFDEEQQQAYSLIHAAKHPKAAVKMKEAVNAAVRTSELPNRSKECIRLSHAVPINRIVELVRDHFEGKDANWTDKSVSGSTVQGYALAETPMMWDQAVQLKAELTRGYLLEKRPLRFRFPAAAQS